MDLYLTSFLFIIGLLLILKGGDIFIDSAVLIAGKLGVSHTIIGATIVSLGTTLPEVATSFNAALKGQSQFALGNAIGSINFNTGIILGILIILSNIRIKRTDFQFRGISLLLLTFLLYLLSYFGNQLSTNDGLILLAVLLGYVCFSIWVYRNGKEDLVEKEKEISEKAQNKHYLTKEILLLIFGIIMLATGANLLLENGVKIADFLGIPSYIISLTMVAVGTSLPELVTSIIAMLKKHHSLSIGNILGANILNIGLVIALSAIANPIEITSSILSFDLIITIIFVSIFILFGLYYQGFKKYHGVLLISVYLFYLFCIYVGLDQIRMVIACLTAN